ncbi:hypothetical protein POVWA2_007970 [Plasmodium ovale wallikeri]|uniref:Uncharacterized protein n=1 Tax=Plasmodium ovale wallikeri TaxID=864142 RepID=A0A1A8YKR8_PLAOA|nr:hypothetical protein POVWA2_007970 [Plasmodium ovale wallikeri]
MCTQAGMQADRHNIGVVTSNVSGMRYGMRYDMRYSMQYGTRHGMQYVTCCKKDGGSINIYIHVHIHIHIHNAFVVQAMAG